MEQGVLGLWPQKRKEHSASEQERIPECTVKGKREREHSSATRQESSLEWLLLLKEDIDDVSVATAESEGAS